MKKLSLMFAACVAACLLVAPIANAAERATKVGSTIQVKFKPADPRDEYGTSKLTGKVGPKECAKGRTVSIKGLGSEKTDSKGKFSLTLSEDPEPGQYRVKVAEKKIKKVTCSKVKSTLTIG